MGDQYVYVGYFAQALSLTSMEFITTFFGRFHPLLVHLPIGVLFLAFIFECLSLKRKHRSLRKAVQPALLWGGTFAVAAAISGFFLRQEGGYEEDLADLHQNFGIATAVWCFAVYGVRRRMKGWIADPAKRQRARIALFVSLIVLLSVTGHWGGSLTHGEDYLSAAVTQQTRTPVDPAVKLRAISNIEEAVLYTDVIEPILEARCYDCHSSRKQKGDLRLDKVELIARGGKNGPIIREGPADSSAIFNRLILPIEDDHHMPPGEKPQLSSSEIALIKYWVEEQAQFEKPISQFASAEKIKRILRSLQEAPLESWIPAGPVDQASEKDLRRIEALGVTPMPLATESNYLMVSFTGFREVTDDQLQSLQRISDQLVWLNLGHTRVTDAQLEPVGKLKKLRVLYLNDTPVSDEGLARLSGLTELRWMSLVGTRITDRSFSTLEAFDNLTSLFLYQTAVTQEAVRNFAITHQDVKLDTGNYALRPLPTDTVVYKKVNTHN